VTRFQTTRTSIQRTASNLMDKCSSWVELREFESGSNYNELANEMEKN
jgi:hypothetical protein